jgi:nicotinamidase/pyrazinamidase
MSLKKYVFISFAIILVLTVTGVAVIVRQLYTPTHGKQIGRYANPGKALLVIDVQEDYTGPGKQPVLFRGVEDRIAAINKLIENSSKSAMEVVYIRQIFPDNFITRRLVGRTIEGQPGTELDPRIKITSRNDFTKKISDAFSNPRLEEFLIRNQIDELYLTGLDAAYCIYYTALGARNRGYKVFVVRDAVMTRKNMDEVLKLYRKEGIALTSSGELSGI